MLVFAKESRPSAVEKSGVAEGFRKFKERLAIFDDDGARVVLGFWIGVGGELCRVNDVVGDWVEEKDDKGAGAGER